MPPHHFYGFSSTIAGRNILHESRFSKLHTNILNQCLGITADSSVYLLRSLGVGNRVKTSRLGAWADSVSLGNHDVNKLGLVALDIFVRHDRDVKLPFSKGHFDLWPCVHCPNVIEHGRHCVDCYSGACIAHAEDGIGRSICSFCNAYVYLADVCGANVEYPEDENNVNVLMWAATVEAFAEILRSRCRGTKRTLKAFR